MRNDYFVFGGWLLKLLEKNPTLTKRLGKIKHIHVETANSLIRKSEGEGLRIVFLSRINKMKGIETVLDYAPIAPESVIIEFYGPVANKDEIFFFEKVSALKNVTYLGKY